MLCFHRLIRIARRLSAAALAARKGGSTLNALSQRNTSLNNSLFTSRRQDCFEPTPTEGAGPPGGAGLESLPRTAAPLISPGPQQVCGFRRPVEATNLLLLSGFPPRSLLTTDPPPFLLATRPAAAGRVRGPKSLRPIPHRPRAFRCGDVIMLRTAQEGKLRRPLGYPLFTLIRP